MKIKKLAQIEVKARFLVNTVGTKFYLSGIALYISRIAMNQISGPTEEIFCFPSFFIKIVKCQEGN